MAPGLGHQKRIATIGGTFDALHQGHKDYIKLALDFSDYTIIYLSTDEYANGKKNYQVKPYEERYKRITQFLQQIGCQQKCEIRPHAEANDIIVAYLNEFILHDVSYITIVSPEYYEKLLTINRLRESKGMNSILLVVKPRLRDGKTELSSSAIHRLLRKQYRQ
jgi:cytidyltransferase-like protein